MKADVVFVNGEVLKVDEHHSIQEAVAVKENFIAAVGSNDDIKSYIGEKTEVIDLQGKSLVPGFIDSHVHLTIYGTNLLGVSCIESHIDSLEDIFYDLRMKVKETPKGKWVRAWGFDQHEIDEKRFPTREELDEISREHPILVIRTCNHMCVANSKALELADINNHTPDPEGGIIERDADGQLTGKLIENAHMQMFKVAGYSSEELSKSMKLASDAFIKEGITSIHDAGAYGKGSETLRIMQQAVGNKDIRVRVYAIMGSLTNSHDFVQQMVQEGKVTGLGNDNFKLGPVKLFTDGSSTGPTIATREPYTSDANNSGIIYYSQEDLDHYLGNAHKEGFQITAHAQGDRAIEMLLDCIEKAVKEHPRSNHRHRIEHAGIASPDLQQRMKELEIIPIPNPVFIYVNGDVYKQYYGDRVNVMYPARDYQELGIVAAFGSDAPVTFVNPLLGIHAAVNRKSKSGQNVGEQQRVDVLEALRCYTVNGAFASFDEKRKGSIEAGKLADLVVLSDSLLTIDPAKIKDLGVEMTMIDGKVLFKNEQLVYTGGGSR
ncbi:amidohydrolase [Fictibacillus fluitans]|uniref:Amidohydrolase n=1 Tax=Fictibacillus fluitans TaxID=3058422 RepID=A0ABT8HQH0_9BACL|nr:amidohydrolase [Fictibacillus sp. NE201]MDN4523001.1 amidohydrolase [Fictibacillus sp. NE201]